MKPVAKFLPSLLISLLCSGRSLAGGAGQVQGKVLSLQGKPLSGVHLYLEGGQKNFGQLSGPDGSYAFSVPSGSYLLMAFEGRLEAAPIPLSIQNASQVIQNVRMRDDDSKELLSFHVQLKLPKGGSFTGEVHVEVIGRDVTLRALSDKEGWVAWKNVEPGPYQVRAWGAGYPEVNAAVRISPQNDQLALKLEPGADLAAASAHPTGGKDGPLRLADLNANPK